MRITFDAKRAFNNKTGLGNYSRSVIKSVSSILKANELVNLINDLLFSSAAVIYRGDAELHPICIINSIKNFIGDNRESPSKSLLHFAIDYITSFEFRKDDNQILEKIIRDGVGSTAFLGDLENACQSVQQ